MLLYFVLRKNFMINVNICIELGLLYLTKPKLIKSQ